jgi:hypothetical protein
MKTPTWSTTGQTNNPSQASTPSWPSEASETHQDVALLERLLLPYVLQKGRVRYLRLRNVEIQRDKRGAPLIDLIDIINAVWDAAIGFRQIPPIDPKTNREVAPEAVPHP